MKMLILFTSSQICCSFLRTCVNVKGERSKLLSRFPIQEGPRQSFPSGATVDVPRYLLTPLVLREPECGLGAGDPRQLPAAGSSSPPFIPEGQRKIIFYVCLNVKRIGKHRALKKTKQQRKKTLLNLNFWQCIPYWT